MSADVEVSVPSERDPVTGRTVYQLTQGPEWHVGPYFHQYPFSSDGERMVIAARSGERYDLLLLDWRTGAIEPLTRKAGVDNPLAPVVARATNTLYYIEENAVRSRDLSGGASQLEVEFSSGAACDGLLSATVDGRWIAGSWTVHPQELRDVTRAEMADGLRGGRPFDYFSYLSQCPMRHGVWRFDTQARLYEELWEYDTFISHVMICPTDPDLLFFCHEGLRPHGKPRMMLFRVGTGPETLLEDPGQGHYTHERWSIDGESILFDHMGRAFCRVRMADRSVERWTTGQTHIHINRAPDESFFVGDGLVDYPFVARLVPYSDPRPSGRLPRGMWPEQPRPERALVAVPLCLSRTNYGHQYGAPDAWVTPDGEWVVFRSSRTGYPQMYRVAAGVSFCG